MLCIITLENFILSAIPSSLLLKLISIHVIMTSFIPNPDYIIYWKN